MLPKRIQTVCHAGGLHSVISKLIKVEKWGQAGHCSAEWYCCVHCTALYCTLHCTGLYCIGAVLSDSQGEER